MEEISPVSATLLAIVIILPVFSVAFACWWILLKIGRGMRIVKKEWRSIVERWWVSIPSLLVAVASVGLLLYGWLVEAHNLEVSRIEIAVDRPILSKDRFRIVHLSDLHVESRGERERALVDLVNAQAPDLICLTGDYLNARSGIPVLTEILAGLRANVGIYAVEGNWDRKFDIARILDECKITLLNDDFINLKVGGGQLLIAGMAMTPALRMEDVVKAREKEGFLLMLQHTPDYFEEVAGRGVDLYLCGHTHGGQVCFPFYGALITLSRFHKKYESGFFRKGGAAMVVSRGIGVEGGPVPRVRLFCRPEIVVIDLVHRPGP